jgi:proteasome lid subunit RPN8/RPN11
MTAEIPVSVIDQILAHAEAEAPNECCGLLLGSAGPGAWVIDCAFRARNALDSPTRFQIDPDDHFAAIKSARARGLTVVGAYHSHPVSAAVPSPRDLAEAADPELLHVIVGLPERAVRAYRLCDGNFQAVALVGL